MHTLVVDLKIPIETEPLIGAPAFTFTHWLPVGKGRGIKVVDDQLEILFWFDLKSAWWASQPSEEELKNHVNVLAHYVLAEVTVQNVDQHLANYMKSRDFRKLPGSADAVVQSEYAKLGRRILEILLNRVNRLITFARVVKGQYWLLDYSVDLNRIHGYFQSFEARGCIDGGKQFRFQPGTGDCISISMSPEDKYIRENEWNEVEKFVQGRSRPPMVLELLAGAQQLAGNGYVRSALTEAVTALEVAVSDFARSASCKEALASKVGPRMGVDRLQKQVEHMGLSGTIRYLLPLLLPDDELPANVLQGCRDAIDACQNVVHNGQRDVKNVEGLISSIETCCETLRSFCENS
jgi:hypothetical protein